MQTHADYRLSQLDELESESIHIFREVAAEFERPVLMFSGATPSEPDRIAWLSRMVPLAVLEGSHFIGSLDAERLALLVRECQNPLDFGPRRPRIIARWHSLGGSAREAR